jgi:hypothetical protein
MYTSKKSRITILVLISIAIFFLVYAPHISNPYPIHADEWHHIDQAIKLKQGEITFGATGMEIGFHIFLSIISLFINLVIIYKFLPAIWAVLSALIIFFVTFKKTNNFIIGIFAMVFFASIKSNVNIEGIWFFTPLTFSIPFIFLYIYFFTEGVEKQNKKSLLISFFIMSFLIIAHSISLLFAIPFLIVYCIFHYRYLIKEYKFFLILLLIPILGILFFYLMSGLTFKVSIFSLINQLQFKKGWGVTELNNSPFEIYSLIGYILGISGIVFIFLDKEKIKKYIIFILWPLSTLILIIIFKITDISYLSPYQRNLYYLAISLPFLSAFGLYSILDHIKLKINNNSHRICILSMVLLIILILTFICYYSIPKNTLLYQAIDKDDYNAITFLSTLPRAKVLAPLFTSVAIHPISNQDIVADIYFNADQERKDNIRYFFNMSNCKEKQDILIKYNATYILTKDEINCSWKQIYKENNSIIYQSG